MKAKQILELFIVFLCLCMLSTPVQATETTRYNIEISLLPEGYAEFEIDVSNYNFSRKVIELPILKCDDSIINASDVRKKIRLGIPDYQTEEGLVELNGSCMGVLICRSPDSPKNFTISFTYKNSDWEPHPEKYPLDYYSMPILISFPEIRSDDKVEVYADILLPPNTNVTNISVYTPWEHPSNTLSPLDNSNFFIDTLGNQQIIAVDGYGYISKENPPRAIYIPLEFERVGLLPQFFVGTVILLAIILFLLTIQTLQGKDNEVGILTIAVLLFSYYQFLASDKPAGVITWLDWSFFIFIVWTLLLFIFHLVKIHSDKRKILKHTKDEKLKKLLKEWIKEKIELLKKLSKY